jgi:hypothetical protein
VDVIDAIGTGLKKADEQGWTGVDKAIKVAGEGAKKALTWIITKNPIIGLGDAVVGGVSQTIWGKDNRIDIGAGIDKAASSYENFGGHLGNWWEKGTTQGARDTTKKAVENTIRHINDQIAKGKISEASGHARISRLNKIIEGD